MSSTVCPCCSGNTYEQCCQPIIEGAVTAKTSEALMRSRYTAYCMKKADYIFQTYASPTKASQSLSDIAQWANSADFVSLEIIDTSNSTDSTGPADKSQQAAPADNPYEFVEFRAQYFFAGQLHTLHEHSRFVLEQGQWRYLDGKIFPEKAITPGRNDSCPCGSGKKFKKCHGR